MTTTGDTRNPQAAGPDDVAPRSAAASPCIGICRLDASGTTCAGCLRTLDEIGRWSVMDAAEQARVLAVLVERRSAQPIAAPR